ncbi:unnamed protein product [Victoria cruziana]
MTARPLINRRWLLTIIRWRTEKRWVFLLFSLSLVSLILFLTVISGYGASATFNIYKVVAGRPAADARATGVLKGPGLPPVFAYWISGSRGDRNKVLRLLKAVYHPRNRYLLHLDSAAPNSERQELAVAVRAFRVFRAFGNVDVVGKADASNYMGSSTLAAILHGAAVLLRIDGGWDWFITLSASDYPLVTQDDLLHAFSSIRRDLNFIDHTGDLGWKEYQRANPIVVDPGLYLMRKPPIFYASQKRPKPNAFKFFTGSPWIVLSRSFLEFCVLGWDNLPRILLLYFTNVVISQEGYFHSVICNSPEFQNTTVNNDLRYLVWDTPPKPEPRALNVTDYEGMVESGAAFGRRFLEDDFVLKLVDDRILKRRPHGVVPGGWCLGKPDGWLDPCSKWGNINILNPGPQAKRLGNLISKLTTSGDWQLSQCK